MDMSIFNYHGKVISCPYCGEDVTIEFDTAHCDNCNWSIDESALSEVMEDE